MTGFPAQLVDRVAAWAEPIPEIASVWPFGSRAKGTHHAGSDADIALVMTQEGGDGLGDWICCHDRWEQELAALLHLTIDLDLIDPESTIVGPAVQEHGVLLFER